VEFAGAWLLGRGRLANIPYSIGVVATVLVTAAVVFGFMLMAYGSHGSDTWDVALLYGSLFIGIYLYNVQLIRRLHDANQRGWHAVWIGLANVIGVMDGGGFWSLVALTINLAVMMWPGTPGANRFGPARAA
jgi:uncharacterized membrane protein YhaH (DUF805 family)